MVTRKSNFVVVQVEQHKNVLFYQWFIFTKLHFLYTPIYPARSQKCSMTKKIAQYSEKCQCYPAMLSPNRLPQNVRVHTFWRRKKFEFSRTMISAVSAWTYDPSLPSIFRSVRVERERSEALLETRLLFLPLNDPDLMEALVKNPWNLWKNFTFQLSLQRKIGLACMR